MLVYMLKLKSAGLAKGIRLKCLVLCLAFFVVFSSSAVLLLCGVMCAVFGAESALGGVFAFIGISVPSVPDGVFAAACFVPAAFLTVCAASLAFTLEAEFCFAADKDIARPGSFLSFASGVRYLRCRLRMGAKKAALLARFSAPFILQSLVFMLWLKIYGAEKTAVFVCLAALGVSLLACLACWYVRCRCCDEAAYLMVLNPRLPPRDAVASSEEKTAGKLLFLAVCRLCTLPKRLACFLLLPLPGALPRAGVFQALVCERIYGENKRRVKQPAVTFYINKKTRMEEK